MRTELSFWNDIFGSVAWYFASMTLLENNSGSTPNTWPQVLTCDQIYVPYVEDTDKSVKIIILK